MPALDGLRLQRTTTAQQVADVLSERILAGGFDPGHRLRESAIATELGVARNTVREAVRILELSGLVRYEVHRGAVVIAPTRENVEALYVARERLETAAVVRAPRPEQHAAIRSALDTLAQAATSGDLDDVVEQDLAFHSALVALLDSPRLDAFYADLTRELRFYLRVLFVADVELQHPAGLVAEHEAIADAITAGDTDRAVAEVRRHIETTLARVQQILAERQ